MIPTKYQRIYRCENIFIPRADRSYRSDNIVFGRNNRLGVPIESIEIRHGLCVVNGRKGVVEVDELGLRVAVDRPQDALDRARH